MTGFKQQMIYKMYFYSLIYSIPVVKQIKPSERSKTTHYSFDLLV